MEASRRETTGGEVVGAASGKCIRVFVGCSAQLEPACSGGGEVLSVDEMLCRYARSEKRERKRAPTAHRSGLLSL
jgi:hypothetical protein